MKFGTLHQIMNPVTVTWPKIEIFKIQDGGDRHLEDRFFGHKSLTDCPISAKFCMRKQNSRSTNATWQKLHIFKFQHGGRPPFWKSLNCHISVKNRPILMKFGTLHQILNPISHVSKNYNFWNSRWRLPPSWKSFFWPLLINRLSDFSEILYEKAEQHADKGYRTNMQMCKIQDGGRQPFWKSLNRHISVKNCPILMKFCTLHHILNPVTVTSPKIGIFGVQDGGGRHL